MRLFVSIIPKRTLCSLRRVKYDFIEFVGTEGKKIIINPMHVSKITYVETPENYDVYIDGISHISKSGKSGFYRDNGLVVKGMNLIIHTYQYYYFQKIIISEYYTDIFTKSPPL